MYSSTMTLTPFYRGWEAYQGMLVAALAPLTDAQLALRASPPLRPVWFLAAHIIGARVWWFHQLETLDPALMALGEWDVDDAPPRTAAELAAGLEATWGMIAGCLDRWTPAMLDDPLTTPRGRAVTRQWVIWHVLEHDLHHGGELCLTLGVHDLPTPDL